MPHAEIKDVYYKFGKHTGERMGQGEKLRVFCRFFRKIPPKTHSCKKFFTLVIKKGRTYYNFITKNCVLFYKCVLS